ncbi:hypothetical protein T02_6043 [Trichinella nativa]|uniref:Uncharacterized protein n=1 Tax=Trichinella nativa TaxID=6335 RepID=A0A0V1LJY8_9BILA|nr:hypothetical protein T02_6043 [Trichinella nativa]
MHSVHQQRIMLTDCVLFKCAVIINLDKVRGKSVAEKNLVTFITHCRGKKQFCMIPSQYTIKYFVVRTTTVNKHRIMKKNRE